LSPNREILGTVQICPQITLLEARLRRRCQFGEAQHGGFVGGWALPLPSSATLRHKSFWPIHRKDALRAWKDGCEVLRLSGSGSRATPQDGLYHSVKGSFATKLPRRIRPGWGNWGKFESPTRMRPSRIQRLSGPSKYRWIAGTICNRHPDVPEILRTLQCY